MAVYIIENVNKEEPLDYCGNSSDAKILDESNKQTVVRDIKTLQCDTQYSVSP
jgi:hypothetical protein